MKDTASAMPESKTVVTILREIAADPWRELISRWNWKAALMSGLIRAGIFFSANLSAGTREAVGAMAAEFVWRFALSGFYGGLMQRLRFGTPQWLANLLLGIALPVTNHAVEFAIHYTRGTPNLKTSIVASVCFTAISMLFNLYAMRQGAMVTGAGGESLAKDLMRMPRIVVGFVLWLFGFQRSSQSLK
jgi:hypothetical protein